MRQDYFYKRAEFFMRLAGSIKVDFPDGLFEGDLDSTVLEFSL